MLKLSIIVIFHDMLREAECTLYSLSTAYQSDVSDRDYDIIVIDNGSTNRLESKRVAKFGPNFQYHFFATASQSPAAAINHGVKIAQGTFVACIVDGARMVTPGLIGTSLRALQAFPDPFVCALAWHLGPDVQNLSIAKGYNQLEEDKLLESIKWRHNGYRLFEISTLAQSSDGGFLGGLPTECSWFGMLRAQFLEMGGYDERFQSPGGGLVNHDFLNRVLLRPKVTPVVILGEGSFHQIHGGVATNVPLEEHPINKFHEEYQILHGKHYNTVGAVPYYFGTMPPGTMKFINKNVKREDQS